MKTGMTIEGNIAARKLNALSQFRLPHVIKPTPMKTEKTTLLPILTYWVSLIFLVLIIGWLFVAGLFLAMLGTWHCRRDCRGILPPLDTIESGEFGFHEAINLLTIASPFLLAILFATLALVWTFRWLTGKLKRRQKWFRSIGCTVFAGTLFWALILIFSKPNCSCNTIDTNFARPIWNVSMIGFLASFALFLIFTGLSAWSARLKNT